MIQPNLGTPTGLGFTPAAARCSLQHLACNNSSSILLLSRRMLLTTVIMVAMAAAAPPSATAFGATDFQRIQVFQGVMNTTSLQWNVYLLPANKPQSLMSSATAATFPAHDMLRVVSTTYKGTTLTGGVMANVWETRDVWTLGNTVQALTAPGDGRVLAMHHVSQGVEDTTLLNAGNTVPFGVFEKPRLQSGDVQNRA